MTLATLVLSLAVATLPAREPVTVRMVINTNTVAVATQDDPMLWVTLLGVGTPETVDARKPDHLLGKPDPGWLAAWLAPGTRALMERRGESASGRPLVFLYRLEDGYCWNAHLVKVGGAFAAQQAEFPEFGKLAGLEDAAQRRGAGIWRGYAPAEPPGPALEPTQVVARAGPSAAPAYRGFDPAHFPRPAKKQYASQALARAQAQAMMGSMLGRFSAGGPQMNHVNAAAYLRGGGGAGAMMNGPGDGYTVHVNGYYRQDGTYVQSYYRRPPGTAGGN